MLGLRYYACAGCETVFAGVEEPPGCDRCGDDRFDELSAGRGAAAYFAPPGR